MSGSNGENAINADLKPLEMKHNRRFHNCDGLRDDSPYCIAKSAKHLSLSWQRKIIRSIEPWTIGIHNHLFLKFAELSKTLRIASLKVQNISYYLGKGKLYNYMQIPII